MASEIRSISELAYTSPWASKIRSHYMIDPKLIGRAKYLSSRNWRQYPNYETGVISCEACRSFNKTFLYLFLQVSSEFYDTTKFQVKAVLKLADSNRERLAAFRHSTKWVNKIYNTISSRKAMIIIVEC